MFWRAEALRIHDEKIRGAAPIAIDWVPRPLSAHLSVGGRLSWTWHADAVLHSLHTSIPVPFRRIHAHLCQRFAALADESDEAIRRFAERWGPLRYPKPRADLVDDTEALVEWRRFATLARALVRCAVGIGERTPGRPDDWRSIGEWLQAPHERDPAPEYGLVLVASALNLWHARSAGSALVEVQKTKMVMRPRSVFLFGIIGLQLAYAITGAQDTLVCYHCGKFDTPKNKARTGSRNFCRSCQRLGKPQLYAMRDLRARRKQAHRK